MSAMSAMSANSTIYVIVTGHSFIGCESGPTENIVFTISVEDFFRDVPLSTVFDLIKRDKLVDDMQVCVDSYQEFDDDIDELTGFSVNYINVSMTPPEKDDNSEDNSEDDNSEDEDNSKKNDWSNLLIVEYKFDSHYNCYCKTHKVCGCGCDPLHDGW